MIPNNASHVLVINPSNNTVTRVASGETVSVQNKWVGGVLALDGNIYGIPFNSTNILKINTTNDTISLIPYNTSTFSNTTNNNTQTILQGTNKFRGGALGADGLIYMIPSSATKIIQFNPVNLLANTIAITDFVDNGWCGGILAQDSNIYCIPHASNNVLIINTLPTTVSETVNSVTTINPAYGTTTTISTPFSTESGRFNSGILSANGKIYCFPLNASKILVIDPITSKTYATTLGATFSGSTQFVGGVLGPNGKIYGVPASATKLLTITMNGFNNIGNWMYAPEFNKF